MNVGVAEDDLYAFEITLHGRSTEAANLPHAESYADAWGTWPTLAVSHDLLAVPMAPLIGSLLAGVLGTALGGNRIGRKLSHTFTILGVLLSFSLSAVTLKAVAVDGAHFNETLYTWMVVGGLKMEVGFLVDGLTAMMMVVVTFVSLMVHLYTIGYMHEDEGYNRFFAYISLFTFSMLMLVMSNNMLQLFFGWEAVGLVS